METVGINDAMVVAKNSGGSFYSFKHSGRQIMVIQIVWLPVANENNNFRKSKKNDWLTMVG